MKGRAAAFQASEKRSICATRKVTPEALGRPPGGENPVPGGGITRHMLLCEPLGPSR